MQSSLTSLLNELTSRHQVMTRQMEKIAPLTLGDLIERIVDLLDDTAQAGPTQRHAHDDSVNVRRCVCVFESRSCSTASIR